MEQYELSIDISNHEDMNHTYPRVIDYLIGKMRDNDQNASLQGENKTDQTSDFLLGHAQERML
jgi:hypothetical protein